jgi:hypothetical protein
MSTLDLANALVSAATSLRDAIAAQQQPTPQPNPAPTPQPVPDPAPQPAPAPNPTPFASAMRIQRGVRAYDTLHAGETHVYVFNTGPTSRAGRLSIADYPDRFPRHLCLALAPDGLPIAPTDDFQPTITFIIASNVAGYPSLPLNTDVYALLKQDGDGRVSIDLA